MRKLFTISLTKNLASLFNTKTISYNTANVLLAIFLTALYNDSLWLSLYKIVGIHNASSIYFYFAFFVLATAVCFFCSRLRLCYLGTNTV